MKIAIIHHQYAKKGGMETYLLDLINGFAQEGDSVEVITYRQDKQLACANCCKVTKRNVFLPGMLRKFGFMYYINNYFDKSKYDLSLSLMRTASQDAIVCGGTHRGYLRYLRKKASIKDKIETYFECQAYRKTPHIIAHSQMLKDEIIEMYNVSADKIHLLYPPVNTEVFNQQVRQERDEYRKKFALVTGKTSLLFPSTGHKRKGWFELIEAMNQLPADKFELVVAGSKADRGAQQLNNVRWLGFVENMSQLYAAVDFTILPSHYEPYGLVVAESLQCGTPVIISNKVGAKDFVSAENGVVFNEVTAESIVNAILHAMQCKNDFHIAENFAQLHGLTIEQHIKQIKSYCLS